VAKLRSRWGLPPETKIVLQAARLTRPKGHSQTIEAARLLHDEGALHDTVIVFAGEASDKSAYRQELLALIGRYGLEDKVRLVGHCQDMQTAFLSAYVALVPSLMPETFGRTSIEAQAMGCPVILVDLGALPETIVSPEQDQSGFTGWLVPPADAAALASRIKRALNLAPDARAALGTRARQHVTAEFSLHQMQQATLAVYDELLGTRLAARFREHVA